MNNLIKSDLFRVVPKPYNVLNLIQGFRSKGFRYLFFRRLFELSSSNNPFRYIYKILLRHYTVKYGFQIGGKIECGFFIGHFGTIVVNNDVVIGKNCNISHGVTIGVTRRGSKAGVPIIGDEVWIGANAVIVGKIRIGNNVLIAPGAYVNFDVPEKSIVIGNPGLIKPHTDPTSGYINNKWIS